MQLQFLEDYELAIRHAEHIRTLSAPDLPSLGGP
jgi:hypothetical protein